MVLVRAAIPCGFQETPVLSPAHAGLLGWRMLPPAEAGVYYLPPPTAAESSLRSGLQEIATGFSRWNSRPSIEPA
jgi:hypothetical protein